MVECNAILGYLSCYYYDEVAEKVIIKYDAVADGAAKEYERVREILEIEPDSYDNWVFDIALDCVKNMKDSDIAYVNAGHLDATEYHMGFAMYVRNKYIWHAEKHFSACADSTSSSVMEMIFTLVNPIYDFRNQRLCDYFGESDFTKLVELYWDEHEKIFWEIAEKVKLNSAMSGKMGVEEVKQRIKAFMGIERFKSVYCDLVNEFAEDNDYKTREDRFEHELRRRAFLFPKECNQIVAVKKLSIDFMIRVKDLKSIEDCKEYIISGLGLRDEDAMFIARCVWEAYNIG